MLTAIEESTLELLRCGALLAGLGPHAIAAVEDLEAHAMGTEAEDRTCIDGGNQHMIVIHAPAIPGYEVLSRQGNASEGATPWLRTRYGFDGAINRWHVETYQGEPQVAWDHSLAAARAIGAEEQLRQYHATLGCNGRIYSAAWSLDIGEASVSWQLDRGVAPSVQLAALGLEQAWLPAAHAIGQLFNHSMGPRHGPWSIMLPLGETGRIRIGTSRWAVLPEDDTKRRRMTALARSLGGSGRFGEAIYKLVAAHAERPGFRIGRAVEVEVVSGEIASVEWYLALP